MPRNFRDLLEARWAEGKFVCVGLDTDITKVPESVPGPSLWARIVQFNCAIVDAVHDLVCAFKPNIAFYEAYGEEGWRALDLTMQHIHDVAPDVPVILDAKRADIGNTNMGYVNAAFAELDADAITVHPYLGEEALRPFLDRTEKGIIVLCRTSNPGAGEFQDLLVNLRGKELLEVERRVGTTLTDGVPFYQYVAFQVATKWNRHGNCAVVAGATYPAELAKIRRIVGDMPILIPGIGKQGGDVVAAVNAGKDSDNMGMIINSSSGVIYASSGPDFPEASRREVEKIQAPITEALAS